MTITTILALIVLICAVLLAVGVIPHTHVVVGILIAGLAGALLVGAL